MGIVDDSTMVIVESVVGDLSWWHLLCANVFCIAPYDGGVVLMAQTRINYGCCCQYRHLNFCRIVVSTARLAIVSRRAGHHSLSGGGLPGGETG